MKPYRNHLLTRAAHILTFSTLLLTACEDHYLETPQPPGPPLTAKVRFVNARPVTTGLHFWTYVTRVTSEPVVPNASSAYLDTQFGDVQISFSEGNNTTLRGSYQFGGSATFGPAGGPNGPIPDYFHTVFAASKKTSATADSLILFYDDLTPPAAGKARVRFVHLAAGAPSVDVINADSGTPLFTGVSYGRAANSVLSGDELSAYTLGPFIEVDAGTVNLDVQLSENGTIVPLAGEPLKNLALESGKIYTIFASGLVNGTPAVSAGIIVHN